MELILNPQYYRERTVPRKCLDPAIFQQVTCTAILDKRTFEVIRWTDILRYYRRGDLGTPGSKKDSGEIFCEKLTEFLC